MHSDCVQSILRVNMRDMATVVSPLSVIISRLGILQVVFHRVITVTPGDILMNIIPI